VYEALSYKVILAPMTSLGAQFTCFTSSKVQILTQKALVGGKLFSIYLLNLLALLAVFLLY
jgi:hypothetical protein